MVTTSEPILPSHLVRGERRATDMVGRHETGRSSGHADFEAQTRALADRVRAALGAALASAQANPRRPHTVGKALGLDKSLAWKIGRIASRDDALTAIARIPGRSGQRLVLDALRSAAVPPDQTQELEAALDEFEAFVGTHAGDRETFQAMVAALTPEGRTRVDEGHRRLAFQGNCATWGVQARAQVSVHFAAPSKSAPDMLDLAVISGLVDLQRLRQNVPWSVATVRTFHDDGSPVPAHIEGIDQSWRPGSGPPLLREFCSNPLPPLSIATTHDGVSRYRIDQGPIGRTGGVTCYTGWISRACFSRWKSKQDQFGEHFVTLGTPAELLVHELYLHRDCWPIEPPRVACYGQLPGGPVYPHDGRDASVLPLADPVVPLSTPSVQDPDGLPRHSEMVELAIARLGHKPSDFRGVRFLLRYPPIPAVLAFRYPLSERPE